MLQTLPNVGEPSPSKLVWRSR